MNHSSIQTLNGIYRVVVPEQTYQRVLPLMDVIGASAAIDLTDYDSLSIPVYTIKTNDSSAYGKGIDRLQSQVSAMMEAIERYSARHLPSGTIFAQYAEMKELHQILDPKTTISSEISIPDYAPIEWLPGTDILSKKTIWVPAYYVLLKTELSGPQMLKRRTSNGLASGNTFDEAVCHALYELIERDAWTLAWLQSVTVPQMKYIAKNIQLGLGSERDSTVFAPHIDGFPSVYIESLPKIVRELVSKFEKAGMPVVIRNVTSDVGIATFIVGCHDGNCDYYGMGTHLNSTVALIRAITECAQTYHIRKYLGMDHNSSDHQIGRLRYKMVFSASKPINFDEISSYENNNLHDDLRIILANLIKIGINQVITLDITHQKLGIPVVRVVAPGLEDWSTHNFSPNHCVLGYRGQRIQRLSYTSHTIS